MLEHRGERPDRRLVARDDGDHALHVVRGEVEADAVVHDLAADQREAHPLGSVQLAVGNADRVGRRDEPHGRSSLAIRPASAFWIASTFCVTPT